MSRVINKFIMICLIYIIISIAWQALEILFYGELKPDAVDSIIGAIFALSVYENIKHETTNT